MLLFCSQYIQQYHLQVDNQLIVTTLYYLLFNPLQVLHVHIVAYGCTFKQSSKIKPIIFMIILKIILKN